MSQRASRCGGTMPGKFEITKDKRGEYRLSWARHLGPARRRAELVAEPRFERGPASPRMQFQT